MSHVAGMFMIAQVTDSISWGNLIEGAMKVQKMLDFVLVHNSALYHSSTLIPWMKSFTDNSF